MYVDFLEASDGRVLTKSFFLNDDAKLVVSTYPLVRNFKSHRETINTTQEFHEAIVKHANMGHCLLKGLLDRPLESESRAGHTNRYQSTNWMVIDNDHLDDISPEELMGLLGLGDVNYIVQSSSSAGIIPGKNSYHIFFLLDKPYLPQDLKQLLMHWNLNIPVIKEKITLTDSHNDLKWPLDISVVQNDKLIYIAPPRIGPGIVNTLSVERVQLITNQEQGNV